VYSITYGRVTVNSYRYVFNLLSYHFPNCVQIHAPRLTAAVPLELRKAFGQYSTRSIHINVSYLSL
jgi:hypothetical protein